MTSVWNAIGAALILILSLFFIYGAAKLATAGILQAKQDFEAKRQARGVTDRNKEH